MSDLLNYVGNCAGDQRRMTFIAAAEYILSLGNGSILLETGCYRGIVCDGQSTLILALLAKEIGGQFFSYDLEPEHIVLATELLKAHNVETFCTFIAGDSSQTLKTAPNGISFAYLDSYDFQEEQFIQSQSHQLIELGFLLPRMNKDAAFLLDDCDLPHGGKARLAIEVLLASGFSEEASSYQKLFVRNNE